MMSKYYLEFEKPFKNIDDDILELESSQNPDTKLLKDLEIKRAKLIKGIYSSLSRWQRV